MQDDSSTAVAAESDMSEFEEDVLRSLRRVIRAVDLYSRKLVAQTGLSSPQLICLRQLGRDGAIQTSHLASAINLSAATVCGILDRLEQRGFVIRERQTDDKRRVLVSLTESGRSVLESAPPALHQSFLFKLRALPQAQQASIHDTLAKIVTMMAAEDLDAAPILVPGDSVTPGPGGDSVIPT